MSSFSDSGHHIPIPVTAVWSFSSTLGILLDYDRDEMLVHVMMGIGFIEASMMRLFLLSDRGLSTQHAEPALKSRVRLRASMLSPL